MNTNYSKDLKEIKKNHIKMQLVYQITRKSPVNFELISKRGRNGNKLWGVPE
jgi:hypothetical protein